MKEAKRKHSAVLQEERERRKNFVFDRKNLSFSKNIESGIEIDVRMIERAGRVLQVDGGG
jgi:hypothetical protein